MNAQTLPSAILAAALMGSLAPASFAASAGHIANPLTDRLIVAPLKQADTVWDVFQVLNGWLGETYPQQGDARTAINAFDKFIKEFNTEDANNLRAPRTVEMPLSVDRYVRLLRKEAPGVGRNPVGEQAKGNIKAQLATAALLPFLQARGIAYRLRPLVAQSFVLHNAAVNNLRKLKQDLRVRSGNNGLAIFEFLTYPLAGRKREPIQFTRFSELQDWLSTSMIPTLDVSIEMGENALAQMSPGQKLSVDLTVFLKADNPFPDESKEAANRYYTSAEVQQFLGRMYRLRAGLRLATAYHVDDFPKVSNKLQKVLTEAFFREKVSFREKPRLGSPAVVRYTIIKKFGKFLTLRDGSQGPLALEDLRKAWSHFSAAVDSYYASSDNGDNRIVDLGFIQATQKDFKTKVQPQIAAALSGAASVTDYIGGTTVDVDLPGLLSALPGDLKAFFPTEFETVKPKYWEFGFSSGKVSYTNYDYGTPVGWDKGGPWSQLFPGIRTESNADGHWDGPLWIYRDVDRTYLGGLLAPALSLVIY